jgi:hypothetical protein
MAWTPSTAAVAFATQVASNLQDGGVSGAPVTLVAKAVYDAMQGVAGLAVSAKSSGFTASPKTYYRCNATTGNIVVTVPAGSGATLGALIYVKKIDASANLVTLQSTGGDTIDGSTTYVLSAQWQSVTILATTTGWDVIGKV